MNSIYEDSQDFSSNDLVFIDAAIEDRQTLANAFGGIDAANVFFIDDNLDGIEQIASALTEYVSSTDFNNSQYIESIRIFSHGSSGTLQLGNSVIDTEILGNRQDELTGLSEYLSDDADIHLYGCYVAQGASGQAFIEQLADLTGADVAASVDLTGSTSIGDWVLEATTGTIQTESLNAEALASFEGHLHSEDDGTHAHPEGEEWVSMDPTEAHQSDTSHDHAGADASHDHAEDNGSVAAAPAEQNAADHDHAGGGVGHHHTGNEYVVQTDPAFQSETILTGLDEPKDIAFLPDGRALIATKGVGCLNFRS